MNSIHEPIIKKLILETLQETMFRSEEIFIFSEKIVNRTHWNLKHNFLFFTLIFPGHYSFSNI